MNEFMRFLCVPVLVIPLVATAAPQGPAAKPSPCGVKALPLSVGNRWTYSLVPSPVPTDPQIARIAPAASDTVIVTVKSITSAQNGDTVITLEEKSLQGPLPTKANATADNAHTITTTMTCNKNKFAVSPDSFWFAGEPGGYLGLRLDAIERPRGTSFQLTNGHFGEAEWREDLVASWTRVPNAESKATPGSGKLELERRFTPQQPERVQTTLGSYKAEKLGLITTGRVTLGRARNVKPTELPAGWLSTLWIAEGTGVVQTLNPFGHMYQLTAITLK